MVRQPIIIILLVYLTAPVLANSSELYFPCITCHGESGQGYPAKNAPAIAGQSAEYIARQLENFKAGKRGAHEADIWGGQMALMAVSLELSNIPDLADYLASLPPWQGVKVETVPDPEAKMAFASCVACHGSKGEGNIALNSPRIAGLDVSYVARQLRNFRDGIRGTAPGDTYGNQMRASIPSNWEDASIMRLAKYISGL